MSDKVLIAILVIQFVCVLLIFFSGKDKESKIVLKPSKILKKCTEKWTYINGIPIGFEVLWSDEVEAYFKKLQKKVNENVRDSSKTRKQKKQRK